MKMKKTFAGIIASIVAVSAMATSMVSAADIKIDQTATTKTTATATLDLGTGQILGGDDTVDIVINDKALKSGAPTDAVKFTSVATKVNAKITIKDGLTTKTVDATEISLAAGGTTLALANADIAAGTTVTKVVLTISATKPEKFNATYADLVLATFEGLTATTSFTFADDTTITLDNPANFTLLASEVKDAAVNGATVKLGFKATTADKTTVSVMSSQSRAEYKVDVAKGATTASIALPKEAFSAGVTNTLTFTTTGLTLTAATLAIAPAAVTTTAATTTAAPAVTTAATTVPNASQPKTGSAAPVALAIIPVALAAAFVAKKKA